MLAKIYVHQLTSKHTHQRPGTKFEYSKDANFSHYLTTCTATTLNYIQPLILLKPLLSHFN